MSRGADFFPAFQEFIASGGVARFKNTAVMSVRINNVFDLDVLNGSFRAKYFLDLAFWVPAFDCDFYADESTVGQFARYEPKMDFPDTVKSKFLGRTVEFSKDPNSRRHEIQLGQNAQRRVKLPPAAVVACASSSSSSSSSGFVDMITSVRSSLRRLPPPKNKKVRRYTTSQINEDSHDDHDDKTLLPDFSPSIPIASQQDSADSVSHQYHMHLNSNFLNGNGLAQKTAGASVLRANAPTGHWPRLWRTLVPKGDLKAMLEVNRSVDHMTFSAGSARTRESHKNDIKGAIAKGNKKDSTTSEVKKVKREEEGNGGNSDGGGYGVDGDAHDSITQLRRQLRALDKQRAEVDLAHPQEGIVFMTHEVEAICMDQFELKDFPYDTQALTIQIRLDKSLDDPLYRYIVPLCSDKAFFCSSRVSPLVEWSISLNCDWEVTTGSGGNSTRDGGKQRLTCRVLVQRKSFFYTLHYIVIAFSITTIVFGAFTVHPEEITARNAIVLTSLLTVVAFNYVCQDKIPKVPYSTVLDKFLIANHMMILAVYVAVMFFTRLHSYPDTFLSRAVGGYKADHETKFGAVMFMLWILGNIWFWNKKHRRVRRVKEVMEFDEVLGLMDFSLPQQSSSSERDVIDPENFSPVGTLMSRELAFYDKLFNWGGKAAVHRREQWRLQLKQCEDTAVVAVGGDGETFFYDR